MGSASSRESKHRWRWVDEHAADRLGIDKGKAVTKGGTVTEFDFAVQKAETSGQYGKPAAYWKQWQDAIDGGRALKIMKPTRSGKSMGAWQLDATLYRTPNPEIADTINTVLKMAQKRAYVAATLSATNASEYFTQDMDDFVDVDYSTLPSSPSPGDLKAAKDPALTVRAESETKPEPEKPPELSAALQRTEAFLKDVTEKAVDAQAQCNDLQRKNTSPFRRTGASERYFTGG